jgi:hypothetical protein
MENSFDKFELFIENDKGNIRAVQILIQVLKCNLKK